MAPTHRSALAAGAPPLAIGPFARVRLDGRRGLVYGLLLFLVSDEALNTELGFAGPPDAYPKATHIRGLVGHLVLGVATDSVADILGG
jgi:hypothetical protein